MEKLEYKVRPLKFSKELSGISKRQIDEHHDVLYAGYVKKLNEIHTKIETADVTEANATFSQIRELKLEETFARNAVELHEEYFDNLGGDGVPKGVVLDLIKEDFGSFEKWQQQFVALGISARGWVILAFDKQDLKLHNYLSDFHSHGGVWNCSPILVLDVYEHAYFLDYGTARRKYLDAFMKNVDWDEVNKRVERHMILEMRKQTS